MKVMQRSGDVAGLADLTRELRYDGGAVSFTENAQFHWKGKPVTV